MIEPRFFSQRRLFAGVIVGTLLGYLIGYVQFRFFVP